MDCFWGGLDIYISQLMPVGDPRWTMAQYVDLAQQLCGSPFEIGQVEEEPPPKLSPTELGPARTPAVIATPGSILGWTRLVSTLYIASKSLACD